jgi:hypothetical protein
MRNNSEIEDIRTISSLGGEIVNRFKNIIGGKILE